MKISNREFAVKAEWEGGYYELARYGLKAKDIKDKKLAKLWQEFYDKASELDVLGQKIEEYLG